MSTEAVLKFPQCQSLHAVRKEQTIIVTPSKTWYKRRRYWAVALFAALFYGLPFAV